VTATGLTQANVSKHLQLLHGTGFVTRERRGSFVEYAIASPDVFVLCDVMCAQLDDDVARRRAALAATR
jgi:DNA-binding transcriptional ArsR family regulator